MDTPLTPHRIFILPDWIHRAFIRNGIQLTEVTNYSKVREALSIDDMAAWFWANDSLKIDNVPLTRHSLLGFFSGLTTEQSTELNNSVYPLAMSEASACYVSTKLRAANAMSGNEFKFVTVNLDVFVILSEGFLNLMDTPDSRLDFVRKYLKESYRLLTTHEVSRLPIFSLYLKQL